MSIRGEWHTDSGMTLEVYMEACKTASRLASLMKQSICIRTGPCRFKETSAESLIVPTHGRDCCHMDQWARMLGSRTYSWMRDGWISTPHSVAGG